MDFLVVESRPLKRVYEDDRRGICKGLSPHAAKSRLTRLPLGASLEIRRIYSVLVRINSGRHAQSLIAH
jgi:hypothetical protein